MTQKELKKLMQNTFKTILVKLPHTKTIWCVKAIMAKHNSAEVF